MDNALHKDLARLTQLAERTAQAAVPDPWRPGLHLAPPTGWLNDPNGLCCFRGEYHVFYQYAPFDAQGGVKLWGHCKSRDLLTWERCPAMLYPDEPFDLHGAYSGSALAEEDGMYLFYTGSVKHQGDHDYIRTGRENNTVLAYSPDGVRVEWKRPLLRNRDYPAGLSCHVRDPKVWKQDGRYWMVLGARSLEDVGEVLVFESEDRVSWRHVNTLRTPETFGYMWECPDLFQVDGQWFLVVSPQGVQKTGPGLENQYACGYFPLYGDFRGEYTLGTFVPLDFGFDFYAAQTFWDGRRRLLMGWMAMPDAGYRNPTAEYGWQHCLTQLRELSVRDGRLIMRPVPELDCLRGDRQERVFSGEATMDLPPMADILISCERELSLALPGLGLATTDKGLVLSIREGGREERTAPVEELRNLRILMDTSALEIFVNDGEAVMTTRWYPPQGERRLRLRGRGEAVVYPMRPLTIRQ